MMEREIGCFGGYRAADDDERGGKKVLNSAYQGTCSARIVLAIFKGYGNQERRYYCPRRPRENHAG